MADFTTYPTSTTSLTGVENQAGIDDEMLTQPAMETNSSMCPSDSTPYTVQRGDSFYLIARKFGIDVRDLLNANPNITAGRLLVGDVLCVPTGTPSPSCPVGSAAYVVQAGQSVTDVLVGRNISVRALRQYNEGVRLTDLRAGDMLCVPESGDRGLCDDGAAAYEVQEGDTLSSIAQAYGATELTMMRLNPNLLPTDFSTPGQVICLPSRLRMLDNDE